MPKPLRGSCRDELLQLMRQLTDTTAQKGFTAMRKTFISKEYGTGVQVFCFTKLSDTDCYIREYFFRPDPTNSFWLGQVISGDSPVDPAAGNDIYRCMLSVGYRKEHPQDIKMMPVMDLDYWRETHEYLRADHPDYF